MMQPYLSLLAHRMAAAVVPIKNCQPGQEKVSCSTTLPIVSANGDTVQIALQYLFGVLAALTLIYIVFMGFRYVISQGEPQEIKKIRDGIIYAVVGLVIALSAEIIVTFVLNKL